MVLLVILTILYTVARIYQSRCCITPSYKQFFLLVANHWPLSIPSENIRKTSDVFRVHNKKILVWNVFLIFNRKRSFFKISLLEKCPYLEFFWSVFSRIRTEYGYIRNISLYSIRMHENMDQKKPEYWHFSCDVCVA